MDTLIENYIPFESIIRDNRMFIDLKFETEKYKYSMTIPKNKDLEWDEIKTRLDILLNTEIVPECDICNNIQERIQK